MPGPRYPARCHGDTRRTPAATPAAAPPKITYTSANVDLELFHQLFDDALARVRGESGRAYPFYIDDAPITTSAPRLVDRSPIDTRIVLG